MLCVVSLKVVCTELTGLGIHEFSVISFGEIEMIHCWEYYKIFMLY